MVGPSRILVLGPDSSTGLTIAGTILPILGSNGSPERAIALASMLALIVGAIMIAAGIAELGFVADLLSKHADRLYGGPRANDPDRTATEAVRALHDANGLINEAKAFVKWDHLRGGRRRREFFQGFAVSTSGSRTAVAEQAGAKTQLTGVVGAKAIVLMLVLVPGVPKNLPNPPSLPL